MSDTKNIKQYEFIEYDHEYWLMCNGFVEKKYYKYQNSKQEAEQKAADVVNSSIAKYGLRRVIYFGLLSVEDFQNHA